MLILLNSSVVANGPLLILSRFVTFAVHLIVCSKIFTTIQNDLKCVIQSETIKRFLLFGMLKYAYLSFIASNLASRLNNMLVS